MGGNALKIRTQRLPADEYHRLASEITEQIQQISGARAEPLRAYRNKADFGDLDILAAREGALSGPLDLPPNRERRSTPIPPTPAIQALLELAERHHARDTHRTRNSSVFSFEHRKNTEQDTGFQVDVILTEPALFQATADYMAYNDLGNLAGRLAQTIGLKYGTEGLILELHHDAHTRERITLTTDTGQIHRILGLDHRKFQDGFDSLEQIYAFVMESSLFHPAAFNLEGANHRRRKRDAKRANYSAFLEKCQNAPGNFQHPPTTPHEDDVIRNMAAHFPWLRQDVMARRRNHAENRKQQEQLRIWFNGESVSRWSGLSGKPLGDLMERLRADAGGVAELNEKGEMWAMRRSTEIIRDMAAEHEHGPALAGTPGSIAGKIKTP